MATRQVNTKFELDGEAEYKRAISEISASMRVLDSEMELNKKVFADNANSQEAFAAKADILGRKILEQKDKIAVLEKAVENAKNAYGEADKRTKNWEASLNKAKGELIDMERAEKDAAEGAEGLGEAVEDAGEKTEKSGGLFGGFVVTLGDVKDIAGEVWGALKKIVDTGVEVEKWMIDSTKEAASYADELLTVSRNTGLSVETLQEWDRMSWYIDSDLDTMTSMYTKLAGSISSAQDGTGTAAEAFDRLSVSVHDTDGNLRPMEEVLWSTLNQLSQVTNETERATLANDLFGKKWTELEAFYVLGTDEYKAYVDELREGNAFMNEEQLQTLGHVQDKLDEFNAQVEGAKTALALEFAPYLEEAMENAETAVGGLGDKINETDIVENLGQILVDASSLLNPLADLAENILPLLNSGLEGIDTVIVSISRGLEIVNGWLDSEAFRTAREWLNSDIGQAIIGYARTAAWNATPIGQSLQMGGAIARTGWNIGSRLFGGNASGTDNFPGGWTRINEMGQESIYLPQGTQIRTAQETRSSASVINNYFSINANDIDEVRRVVEVFQDSARLSRMEG